MLVEPLRRYDTPKYPNFEGTVQHPEILQTIPHRWRHNSWVFFSLSTVVWFCTGCPWGGGFATHGIPPSEAEMLAIINSEARTAGIVFKGDTLTLPNVSLPLHFSTPHHTDTLCPSSPIGLNMDGFDSTHSIAYEFVAWEDLDAWNRLVSIEAYQSLMMRQTAEALQTQLRADHPELKIGVFHEPNYQGSDTLNIRQQVQSFIAWIRSQGVM